MVKVSIIMPVYNDANFLNKSINSIINQSLKDIEIICVDDGSTDNSLEILHKFKEEYNFIKIVSQKNNGAGKARNVGLNLAIGEYIAFLDSDDIYVDSRSLEEMYRCAIEQDADMVSANIKELNQSKILDEDSLYKHDILFFHDKKSVLAKEYGIPWFFYKNIFKRSFLDKNNIRFPDYKRGQDPIFLVNILTKIDKFETIPIYLYGYNTSSNEGSNKLNTYEKRKDYINHFKETFDILEEAEYDEMLKIYKKEFFRFLNLYFKNNSDLFKIFKNVFGKNYFKDEFKEEYCLLLINYARYIDSDEDFKTIRNELKNLKLENFTFISPPLLIVYEYIINSQSYKEYKCKLIINKLKKENNNLKNKNKKINKELKNVKKLNKELINSNSWKITKPIRSIKNKIRK